MAAALAERLAFFVSPGCRASDHGLDYVPYRAFTVEEADAALKKAMAGRELSREEAEKYQTYILIELGRSYYNAAHYFNI